MDVRAKQFLPKTFDGTTVGRAPFGPDLFDAGLVSSVFKSESIDGGKIIDGTISPSKLSGPVSGGLPPKYIEGLLTTFVSSDTLKVSSGDCRNSSNLDDISLTSSVILDITSGNVANGNDEVVISGTLAPSGGSIIVGTGTSFLTDWPLHLLTGTISSSSLTITGVGTKFLSEVAVGDLIGTAALGYRVISSITSDIEVIVDGSDTFGSTTANKIEQPTITIGPHAPTIVTRIFNDTSMNAGPSLPAGSGLTGTIGTDGYNAFITTIPQWKYVWAIKGGSGVACLISTQRTTLINPPTGYTDSARRIGAVRRNTGTAFSKVYYRNGNNERWAYYEDNAGSGFTILSGGTGSGSWVPVAANTIAPPTATILKLNLTATSGVGTFVLTTYLRPRNISSITTNVRKFKITGDELYQVIESINWDQPCDKSQFIDFNSSTSSVTLDVDVYGYLDIL